MISKYSPFYHLLWFCLQLDRRTAMTASNLNHKRTNQDHQDHHAQQEVSRKNDVHTLPCKCGFQGARSTWTSVTVSTSSSATITLTRDLFFQDTQTQTESSHQQGPGSTDESQASLCRHAMHPAVGKAGGIQLCRQLPLSCLAFLWKIVSYNGRWRWLGSLHTQPWDMYYTTGTMKALLRP